MKSKSIQLVELSIEDLSTLIQSAVASELQNTNLLKPYDLASQKEDLLTREEAKNLLKTSYTSLWKYDKDGLLPAKRIAGRVYYLRSELLNLLNGAA